MKAVILTEEQAKRVRECLDTFGEGEGHALDAIALLTPVEIPDDVEELAKAIELAILTDTVYTPAPNGRGGLQVLSKGYTKAAALLVAYGDKIRRECGDRGVEWLHPKGAIYNCSLDDAMKRKERDDSLRAAIEGKEEV